MKNSEENYVISDFSKKVIKAVSITCIILLCLYVFMKGFKVLLIILAGILVATFFKGLASIIQLKLPLGDKSALAISSILFVVICSISLSLLFPRVNEQIDVLKKELPEATRQAKQKLENFPVGKWTLNQMESYTKENGQITVFFSSFFGGLADFYIIFFLGMFFMVQPNIYKNGIIVLFPLNMRERANQVLLTIGFTLRRWLLGKIFSMLVVGLLTGIGLAILGIPLALTLAIFAALITFIPNFGPIISLIPAFLLALTIGVDYAVYVCILYAGIQALESNVITPIIQSKMIAFPLALILIAQVLLGIFTGILGLILAVPVTAIIIVLVKMLYIEDILRDTTVEVKGENLYSDEKLDIPTDLEEVKKFDDQNTNNDTEEIID